MTEKPLFIVMERGFEYNDESYDRQEGGNTQMAYLSEADADQEALNRTKGRMRAGTVADYMEWGWKDMLGHLPFLARVDDRDDLNDALKGLPEENLTEAAKAVGDYFFYVEETRLG